MKKYWDDIEIGDKLPIISRPPISRLQIAQFASASDEFSPLNLDDEVAKSLGFNSAYAPGLMSLGFIEDSLRAYAKNMRIISLSSTFQRLIWPGDVLTARGLIQRKYQKNDEYRILFTLWCENQNQAVVTKGSAICLLFKNSNYENKSKLPTPQVSDKSKEALRQKLHHLINQTDKKHVSKSNRQKEFV